MNKLVTLYHRGSKGETRQWRVWTEGPDIITEHGVINGALQVSRKRAEPKNVGKKNETTPDEQALLEAKSLWTFKVERKYSMNVEDAQEQLPLPMLAHSYVNTKGILTSKGKNVAWPCHIQPKLDGVRCIAKRVGDEILLTSRNGKPWNLPHIVSQLAWLPEGMVLDGELYIHGMSCQKLTSWVKKHRPETAEVVYHVYDVPIFESYEDATWNERSEWLQLRLQESYSIQRVEHNEVEDEAEMWATYGKYMANGYEGAILRGLEGTYRWGYRSGDLLKVKKFLDGEFQVVSATDGVGKMKGHIRWTCRNDSTEATFNCTMKCSMPERRQYYLDREKYIGRKLTVQFFERTDDDVPRFPIGVVFRAAADLPA